MVTNKIRTVANNTKPSGEVGWFSEEDAHMYPARGKRTQGMVPSHMAATGK